MILPGSTFTEARRLSGDLTLTTARLLCLAAGQRRARECGTERALEADPAYSTALLLRDLINAGAPPAMAQLPMTPEEVAASYAAAEDDEPDDETADDEPPGDPC